MFTLNSNNVIAFLIGWRYAYFDTIRTIDSYATGEVNAENYKWADGLVGRNVGGTITDSWVEGVVYGNENVGRLVGFNEVND